MAVDQDRVELLCRLDLLLEHGQVLLHDGVLVGRAGLGRNRKAEGSMELFSRGDEGRFGTNCNSSMIASKRV